MYGLLFPSQGEYNGVLCSTVAITFIHYKHYNTRVSFICFKVLYLTSPVSQTKFNEFEILNLSLAIWKVQTIVYSNS